MVSDLLARGNAIPPDPPDLLCISHLIYLTAVTAIIGRT